MQSEEATLKTTYHDSIYRECLEREILSDREKISSCLRTEAEKRDSLQMGTKGLLE